MISRKALRAILVSCLSLFAAETRAQNQDVPPVSNAELIVLLKESGSSRFELPEAIVERLRERPSPDDHAIERLGNPLHARFLIEDQRLTPEQRRDRAPNDAESRLHRYLVLTYAGPEEAAAARSRMLIDDVIDGVVPNIVHDFSVAPQDPEFPASGAGVINYQWGYHPFTIGGSSVGLDMQNAWNLTRGAAWVGIVDNGIQTTHPDLTQIYKPQFAWNVISNSSFVDESYAVPPAPAPSFRGHGTHVAGVIGATSGFPGVAAGYPAFPAVGVAGACWFCTGMIVKVAANRIDATDCDLDQNTAEVSNCLFESELAAGLYWAARRGAQVVNMSFGNKVTQQWESYYRCSNTPALPFCDAMAYADHLDVVMVAASGNNDSVYLQWPASDSRILAVGALQFDAGSNQNRWHAENTTGIGSDHGVEMLAHGIVAPGRDIVSTVYAGFDWAPTATYRCGDATTFGQIPGSDAPSGYGSCTGTSMAAPLVTGIIALMRTVNPLVADTAIKNNLRAAGHLNVASQQFGTGVPDALEAVQAILATTNRLTPLFSLSNELMQDSFYTVAPQQARAAYTSNLLPLKAGSPLPGYYGYAFYGNLIKPNGVTYQIGTNAPNGFTTTKAETWVFSTHANPKEPAKELKPLYRLSFRCGDPVPSGRATTCGSQPYHVGHFYTTDINELLTFTGQHGYRADGIEGYVYPVDGVQHAGSTPLKRGYNSAQDRYALFPSSKQAAMVAAGFGQGLVTLGYVYEAPASGARPSL